MLPLWITAELGTARRKEIARQDVETYTQWCNGDVWYVRAKVYALLRDPDGIPLDLESDYRRADPIAEDGCGGYFGYEEALRGLTEVHDNLTAELAGAAHSSKTRSAF